jgi:hypothetical protein
LADIIAHDDKDVWFLPGGRGLCGWFRLGRRRQLLLRPCRFLLCSRHFNRRYRRRSSKRGGGKQKITAAQTVILRMARVIVLPLRVLHDILH